MLSYYHLIVLYHFYQNYPLQFYCLNSANVMNIASKAHFFALWVYLLHREYIYQNYEMLVL